MTKKNLTTLYKADNFFFKIFYDKILISNKKLKVPFNFYKFIFQLNGENDFSALLSNDKNVIYLKSLDYVNTSTISISDNLYLFETYALNGISSLYLDVLWKKKFLNFLKISQELDIYLNWSVNTNSQIFFEKKNLNEIIILE